MELANTAVTDLYKFYWINMCSNIEQQSSNER